MATASTQAASVSARNAAVKQLIANNQEEYNQLLAQAREQRGLPRNNQEAKLQKRIERLEAQLEQARAELG
jgi:hypothetical protein